MKPKTPLLTEKNKRRAILFLVLVVAVSAVWSVSYFRVFDPYENILVDLRFRMRLLQAVSPDIAVIEIADDTLQQLGYWPLPRDFHASLVDVLSFVGARYIMFDIIFVEPADEDAVFGAAIEQAGMVYLPFVFDIEEGVPGQSITRAKKIVAPLLPSLRKAARHTGYINTRKDTDGKNRWAPLLIEYQGIMYPHIALRMAADYLGIDVDSVHLRGAKLILGEGRVIPVAPDGSLLVNYAGRWGQTFRHYSYVDILKAFDQQQRGMEPIIDLAELKGSVCFVGLTATGTSDLHAIPLENNYPMVGLHANIFNSIIRNQHVYRAPRLFNVIVLFLLLGALLWIMAAKKNQPITVFALTVGAVGIFAAAGIVLFICAGIWIDMFCPIIVTLLLYTTVRIYDFLEQSRKHALVEKELTIAKQIQESFLPEPVNSFAMLDIVARMKTAKHVGGDLYDFCQIGANMLGVLIGDVSGKGVPAALVMAKTISLFRMLAPTADEPSDLLFQLNEEMSRDIPSGVFVTATYLVYRAGTRTLLVASAGHSPTIVVRASGRAIESIVPTEGMPLGLMGQVEFSQEEITLAPGDKFVVYTDGITEARNLRREEFSEERLSEILKSTADADALSTFTAIDNAVCSFVGKAPQHDDCTLIIGREREA